MSLIKENLIFQNKIFNSKENAISFLSNNLEKNCLVKSTYESALLKREKIFPTGLPTGKISVAIPHADSKYVIESTLAFMTLKEPVYFKNMGNPDENLKVSIIIMLAIAEPKAQVKMLQSLMSIVQDQEHLEKLVSYTETKCLYKDLSKTFSEIKI